MTDTGEWNTRRYLSLLGNILIWVIVAIDAWYLWPTQLYGSTSMVIVSGRSMEPTYFSGDLVIARKIEPSVGDVIVYAPEGLGGSQIVHRIIGGNATDGWEMQGDNNNFVDPFTPKGSEIKGVVLVHYANFGRVTVLLLNPVVWAFVLLLAIVLLVWWSGDKCEDEREEPGSDDEEGSGDPPDGGDTEESQPIPGLIDDGEPVASDRAEPRIPLSERAGAMVRRAHVDVRVTPRLFVGRVSGTMAALLLVVGVGVGPASASQLTVGAASETRAFIVTKCATQALAATASGTVTAGSYTAVSLSNIAGPCQSLATTVTLYASDGSQVATGTATPGAASASFTTSPYLAASVTAVVVTVNGWRFVAAWTAPAAPPMSCDPVNNGGNAVHGGGQSCTVTNTVVQQWNSGPGNQYQYKKITFTVTSTTSNFLLTFDLADASVFGSWPAGTPTRVWSNGNAIRATVPAPAYACSSLPMLSLNRNVPWNPSNTGYEIQVSNDPNAWTGMAAPQGVCS